MSTIVDTATQRFRAALVHAAELHKDQTRKGTSVPYVSHLLAVAALVLEDGGSKDEAIAALLHDGPEDQGGEAVLEDIRTKFGPLVAEIVEACSDSFEIPKPAWRPRKERHIAHLLELARGEGALRHAKAGQLVRVVLADKLSNLRSIRADHLVMGERSWGRFNGGRYDTLWYLRQICLLLGPLAPRDAEGRPNRLAEIYRRELHEFHARVLGPKAPATRELALD
ncbi:MAG: HD domain-containing protein [Candidatus Sericytochromatia bacterium]|nr:HD domain-containing protein [Candidatus Sericytochromatia bacterium]